MNMQTTSVMAPPAPRGLSEMKLPVVMMRDILLKTMFRMNLEVVTELSRAICLPVPVTQDLVDLARSQKLVQATGTLHANSGGEMGYQLTDSGKARALDALSQSEYYGAMPVPMSVYAEQVKRQSIRNIQITRDQLTGAMGHLILPPSLLDQLGPAVGDVANRLDHVVDLRCIDHGPGAHRAGLVETLLGDVDAHHACADSIRDHDGGEPQPAAAVNRHPFPRGHPPLADHGAVGRGETAPKDGGRREIHPLGNPHQIDIGMAHSHAFGKRAPVGQAQLKGVVADLVMSLPALGATAARAGNGHGDPVAGEPFRNMGAHRFDHPGHFMAGNVRRTDSGLAAHPALPVAEADARGFDTNDGGVGGWSRVREIPDDDGAFERFVDSGTHGFDLSMQEIDERWKRRFDGLL